MSAQGMFGTAFNCMDGRVQEPVRQYVMQKHGATFVDVVAEAGIDGILAGKQLLPNQGSLTGIRERAGISAQGHGSKHAVVVGHAHCAGNAVSDEEHLADIRKAVEAVRSWGLFETVEGLMAAQGASGEWEVRPVDVQAEQAA